MLSPKPLIACMYSTSRSLKIFASGVTLGPRLLQVSTEAATKYPSSLITHGLGQIFVITRRRHKYDGEVSHLLCIYVWHFHQWYSMYFNISTNKNYVLYTQSHPWDSKHIQHWSDLHVNPISLLHMCVISYLLQLQCHSHWIVYIFVNI